MTLSDIHGNPIGDLPPRARTVRVDMNAIAQRAGIARNHPMESQRIAAKNLLIDDVETLLGVSKALHDQLEGFKARHAELLGSAQTAGVLLALILAQEPEWRWSKEFVAAFVVEGGWVLEDDPAAPEHRWLLRMGHTEPILSAEQQTVEVPDA